MAVGMPPERTSAEPIARTEIQPVVAPVLSVDAVSRYILDFGLRAAGATTIRFGGLAHRTAVFPMPRFLSGVNLFVQRAAWRMAPAAIGAWRRPLRHPFGLDRQRR
jgi:hypothetical protein